MPIVKKKREGLAIRGSESYNDLTGKEEAAVTELVRRINSIQIPPHILSELGLDKDWQKKVSPELQKRILETAQKYKKVLKELSKY